MLLCFLMQCYASLQGPCESAGSTHFGTPTTGADSVFDLRCEL